MDESGWDMVVMII